MKPFLYPGLLLVLLASAFPRLVFCAESREKPETPAVTVGPVPDSVRAQFKLSDFYQKYVSVHGFPIVSSSHVSDYALLEAHYIISSMLEGREDILQGLIERGVRCAVMGYNQFTTDIPEHSDLKPRNLKGYDVAKAPTFTWPDRLRKVDLADPEKKKAEKTAAIEWRPRQIEGWTVQVDTRLIEGPDRELGEAALRVLSFKLYEIAKLVPADRLEKIRQVPIVLERDHPGLKSLQYHPSQEWLVDHGYTPKLAKCVHIPYARELTTKLPLSQQPMVILHELAHAYHDQVLGFDDPRIMEAWKKFKASGKYDQPVLHISGKLRRHYALTDQKEFFAEMTEAFFGTNDFYPFVRGELAKEEPEIEKLLEDIWITPH